MGIRYSIREYIRKLVRKLDYDIIYFYRKKIIQRQKIDVVLDIGANSGQYAKQLRNEMAFVGRIISFEPTKSAFGQLKINAKSDKNWDTYNFALGDCIERRQINVSKNSYSSSLLDILPSHVKSAPESEYIDSEMIEVKTIDSIWSELKLSEDCNIYMKIDTQGFERQVLQGAEESLRNIDIIQIEASLVPLYDGETLFQEMLSIMEGYGYTLITMEPGFSDKDTGQLLQTDCIFYRFSGKTVML